MESHKKKWVFKFLLGLNKKLDEVRGRILAIKPIPNIREVFAEVIREESRKRLMLWGSGSSEPKGLALIARNLGNEVCINTHDNYYNRNQNYIGTDYQQWKPRPWCEHCRKLGTLKKCDRIFMVNIRIGSQTKEHGINVEKPTKQVQLKVTLPLKITCLLRISWIFSKNYLVNPNLVKKTSKQLWQL